MPALSRTRLAGAIAALVAFLAPLVLDVPGLEEPGERMLAIFLMAIVLFVTEAIPLVATAVLIIFLEVLMLTEQALVPLGEPPATSREFWAALSRAAPSGLPCVQASNRPALSGAAPL